jgi:hypothetical protein
LGPKRLANQEDAWRYLIRLSQKRRKKKQKFTGSKHSTRNPMLLLSTKD